MDNNLITVLKEYGFSEKEAKIYLTTLELGSAPASTIARRSGIKRVTSYTILRDLQRRQIVSFVKKDDVSYFQVIDPTKLLENLEKKTHDFKNAVPQLLAMTDVYGNKPKIEYFDGKKGVLDMYMDIVDSSTDLYSFMGVHSIDIDFQNALKEKYVPVRVKNSVKAYVILGDDQASKNYHKESSTKFLKETLIVKEQVFGFTNEINIYNGNKISIAMYTADEMSGVLLTSQKLFDMFKSIFLLIRNNHGGKKMK